MLIDLLQKKFNNDVTSIKIFSNEICYKFISLISVKLIKHDDRIYLQSYFSWTRIKNNIIYD